METMIDQHFRDRWRAIVGVDDMVGLIHQELEKLGVLDNTYPLRQTFLLILSPCQSRDIFGGAGTCSTARIVRILPPPVCRGHSC